MNTSILELEYPHLMVRGSEKKKLKLYPNIIVKCKDLGIQKKKDLFAILLGRTGLIAKEEIMASHIERIILLDQDNDETNQYLKENVEK